MSSATAASDYTSQKFAKFLAIATCAGKAAARIGGIGRVAMHDAFGQVCILFAGSSTINECKQYITVLLTNKPYVGIRAVDVILLQLYIVNFNFIYFIMRN